MSIDKPKDIKAYPSIDRTLSRLNLSMKEDQKKLQKLEQQRDPLLKNSNQDTIDGINKKIAAVQDRIKETVQFNKILKKFKRGEYALLKDITPGKSLASIYEILLSVRYKLEALDDAEKEEVAEEFLENLTEVFDNFMIDNLFTKPQKFTDSLIDELSSQLRLWLEENKDAVTLMYKYRKLKPLLEIINVLRGKAADEKLFAPVGKKVKFDINRIEEKREKDEDRVSEEDHVSEIEKLYLKLLAYTELAIIPDESREKMRETRQALFEQSEYLAELVADVEVGRDEIEEEIAEYKAWEELQKSKPKDMSTRIPENLTFLKEDMKNWKEHRRLLGALQYRVENLLRKTAVEKTEEKLRVSPTAEDASLVTSSSFSSSSVFFTPPSSPSPPSPSSFDSLSDSAQLGESTFQEGEGADILGPASPPSVSSYSSI